eukprot:gene152-153_t
MNMRSVGICRGLSAIVGYIGAAMFPHLRASFGLRRTGLIAIWYQCTLVACAALTLLLATFSAQVFVKPSSNVPPTLSPVYTFAILVLSSRCGLWVFDLVARQIAQETIPEHIRGEVNGTWSSITALFDFSAYGLSMLFNKQDQFSILATISSLMILIAALSFTLSRATGTVVDFAPSIDSVTNSRGPPAEDDEGSLSHTKDAREQSVLLLGTMSPLRSASQYTGNLTL